ncbi:hypothetical protein Bsel_1003 [[Bacillus] selenitireducens MLS10]|uniref:Uncharacterized protein n=1 Tax=Bacillus selenitireducens (strain ATCC 700615 / DSM 15326 / MLS10) TaxID=439292 RepID=D6Y0D3_BACIE|nr:hypothetical protein Bsel_1003 [[Bacillus] selenitireducens MLS10]
MTVQDESLNDYTRYSHDESVCSQNDAVVPGDFAR